MPTCAICGEQAEHTTKCKMCGEKFCADCGNPDEKLCLYCLDEDDENWGTENWDDDF